MMTAPRMEACTSKQGEQDPASHQVGVGHVKKLFRKSKERQGAVAKVSAIFPLNWLPVRLLFEVSSCTNALSEAYSVRKDIVSQLWRVPES